MYVDVSRFQEPTWSIFLLEDLKTGMSLPHSDWYLHHAPSFDDHSPATTSEANSKL